MNRLTAYTGCSGIPLGKAGAGAVMDCRCRVRGGVPGRRRRPGWPWRGSGRGGLCGERAGGAVLQAGEGFGGEVATADGLEQVVDGGGELPFGGGFGFAADRQLAEAH